MSASDTLESIAPAPQASAVGWGAIIAGAVAILATGITLLALGAGVGLTAISPWSGQGAAAKTIGVSAVVWMVVVQWLSAAIGGYLAGRLRLRWTYFDRNEVFFRDTAHGFLSWALALAVVALVGGALATGVLGVAGSAAGTAAGKSEPSMHYFADSLFRTDGTMSGAAAGTQPAERDSSAEAARILAEGLANDLPQEDRTYLATLVSQRTGMSQEDAQKRVDSVVGKAKEALDKTRKAAATLAIATALALCVGAFIAAVAAAYGGHLRDE